MTQMMLMTKKNFARPRQFSYPHWSRVNYKKCKACSGYYDPVLLTEFAGYWICKYCLNDLKLNLPGGI